MPNGSESYPAANDVAAATLIKRVAGLTNTAVAIKATTGNIYGYLLENADAAKAYVQFYDVAAANVTVGTTTPVFTAFVPAQGAIDSYSVVPIMHSDVALSMAATSTATGGNAPGTVLPIVNILYK